MDHWTLSSDRPDACQPLGGACRFGNASAAATDRRTAVGAARRFAPAVAAADSRGGPRRRPRSASRARAPWPRRAQLVLHGVVAAAALQRRPRAACLVSLPVRLGSDCRGSGRRGSLLARGAAGRPADRVERERAEELLLLLPRPSLRCPSPRRAFAPLGLPGPADPPGLLPGLVDG